ncbi:MAG: hypothetical protein LKI24_10870 [Acidipropionibacterium sp.]|jgi:hypothetical protein|nr:hypothetical protein [Acidipropionibacterium sp.]
MARGDPAARAARWICAAVLRIRAVESQCPSRKTPASRCRLTSRATSPASPLALSPTIRQRPASSAGSTGVGEAVSRWRGEDAGAGDEPVGGFGVVREGEAEAGEGVGE